MRGYANHEEFWSCLVGREVLKKSQLEMRQ
jgi:hypothetical protein